MLKGLLPSRSSTGRVFHGLRPTVVHDGEGRDAPRALHLAPETTQDIEVECFAAAPFFRHVFGQVQGYFDVSGHVLSLHGVVSPLVVESPAGVVADDAPFVYVAFRGQTEREVVA